MDFTTATALRAMRSARARWVALVGLLIAESMNMLDSTITTVVAPLIRAELGGSSSDTQWIVAAYTIPFALMLILGGRLGDVFGRRRVFLAGVLGFLIASTTCAVAPSMPPLILARIIQGAFAALIIPQTIGLIRASFAGSDLPKALSFIGPVMGLTAVAGPVFGGLITNANVAGLSWRAVFLVNLPLGVVVLATTPFLREDRPARRPALDFVGFAISAVAGIAIVVPTIRGSIQFWPTWSWASFGAGAVAVGVFVVHVRRLSARGRDPIIEPSLFGDRGFPAALVTSVLYFAVSTGIVFAAVLYVQDGLGRGVLTSSVTVLPFAAGLAASSLFAGQSLVPRFGGRLMILGVGVLGGALAGGVVAAATVRPEATTPWLSIALGGAGLGGGLLTVSFFTTALARVKPHETGSAAGVLNAVQQLGGTLGVAVLGTVYLSHPGTPDDALAVTFAVAFVLCLLTAASAMSMLRSATAVYSPGNGRN